MDSLGSSDVLLGSSDVLLGSSDVLLGSSDVLLGSSDLLLRSLSFDERVRLVVRHSLVTRNESRSNISYTSYVTHVTVL